MMDNRQFNVNGCGRDMLLLAIQLACIQEDCKDRPAKIVSYRIHSVFGMILGWCSKEGRGWVNLPVGMTAEDFLPIVWAWLSDEETWKKVSTDGWDKNAYHDGSNEMGWRVFCGDWGKIDADDVICAVKPSFLWLGK